MPYPPCLRKARQLLSTQISINSQYLLGVKLSCRMPPRVLFAFRTSPCLGRDHLKPRLRQQTIPSASIAILERSSGFLSLTLRCLSRLGG